MLRLVPEDNDEYCPFKIESVAEPPPDSTTSLLKADSSNTELNDDAESPCPVVITTSLEYYVQRISYVCNEFQGIG